MSQRAWWKRIQQMSSARPWSSTQAWRGTGRRERWGGAEWSEGRACKAAASPCCKTNRLAASAERQLQATVTAPHTGTRGPRDQAGGRAGGRAKPTNAGNHPALRHKATTSVTKRLSLQHQAAVAAALIPHVERIEGAPHLVSSCAQSYGGAPTSASCRPTKLQEKAHPPRRHERGATPHQPHPNLRHAGPKPHAAPHSCRKRHTRRDDMKGVPHLISLTKIYGMLALSLLPPHEACSTKRTDPPGTRRRGATSHRR